MHVIIPKKNSPSDLYHSIIYTKEKKNEEKMKRQKFNIQNTKSTLHSYTRATKSK